MKHTIIFPALLGVLLLSACATEKKHETKPHHQPANVSADMHNAVNSLDYYGVYEGTLPAADGPGIATRLTLNKDNTFTLLSTYLGKKGGTFEDTGLFFVQGNLLVLEMQDATGYYQIKEGRLVMLTQDKQEVTGPLAESYVLKQAQVF